MFIDISLYRNSYSTAVLPDARRAGPSAASTSTGDAGVRAGVAPGQRPHVAGQSFWTRGFLQRALLFRAAQAHVFLGLPKKVKAGLSSQPAAGAAGVIGAGVSSSAMHGWGQEELDRASVRDGVAGACGRGRRWCLAFAGGTRDALVDEGNRLNAAANPDSLRSGCDMPFVHHSE